MSNRPRARIRMGDIPMNTIIAVHCPLILKEGNINENILVTRRNFGDVPKYMHNVQHVSIDKIGCTGAMCTNLEVTAIISKKAYVERFPLD
ncbi:hypothetical protein T05_12414 [Trichinella murrelli]|uniref:Uncharacterized protein n=1 Tax=Trichinella murrelli TaxID=144512 RepID=A0A0V0TZ59_9BILA|nr:hypothetical protein T05_12414 [Trichinella murrelli]